MSKPTYVLELTENEAMALVQLLRQVGGQGKARAALDDVREALNDAGVPIWRFIKWRYPHQPIEPEPYPSCALYAYGDIKP